MKSSIGKLGMSAIAGIGAWALVAGEVTWKSDGDGTRANDYDWTNGNNFVGGAKPVAGDTVIIPASTTVRLNASDADSVSLVNSLVKVQPTGRSSRLQVDVASGTFTLSVPYNRDDYMGWLAKTGNGELVLGATGNHAYHASLEVAEGVLRMNPNATSSSNYFFSELAISNSAVIFLCPNGANTRCGGAIYGTGLITNSHNASPFYIQGGTADNPLEVYAKLGATSYMFYQGYVRLMNPANENKSCYAVRDQGSPGTVEFATIGNIGDLSHLGNPTWMQTANGGGTLRYVGTTGETTDRKLSISNPKTGTSVFDAGPHGGLKFLGNWDVTDNSSRKGACDFILTGSNTVPCVLANSMLPNSNDSTFQFHKKGTGTWRFNDGATRSNRGGLWIDEGTIQFESIAEIGSACSLGLATCLFPRGYYGPMDGGTTNYAVSLGADGTTGTFEYVGTNTVRQLTRAAALAGDGRLVNSAADNGAAERRYFSWFAGVSSIAGGLHRLILDGANANGGDEIANVSDGASGRVGIVKRGNGTWRVSGTNTFSGPIEVEQGKLVLVTPHYTWFRVKLKGIKALDNPSYSTTKETSLHELAFFDKDGYRQNIGLVRVEDQYVYNHSGNSATKFLDVILPGECTYAETPFFNTASSGWYYGRGSMDIDKLFDNSTAVQWAFQRYKPGSQGKTGLDTYPLPIMFRLPEGAKPVTSYDIVTHRSGSGTPADYVMNPKCWTVEGSVNGKTWDLLHTMEDAGADGQTLKIRGAGRWMGRDVAYSSADGVAVPYTYGQAISVAPGGAVGASFGAVEYVSVANGATLVAEGDITINGLKVDANGAGTLDGFTFASANGTFEVALDGEIRNSVVLPGTYLNCEGLENVAGWSVKVNGLPSRKYRTKVVDGKIVLAPKGITVSFK